MTPFDYVNSINSKNSVLDDDVDLKQYNSYVINTAFSLYPDTLFYANMININSHIPNKMQYDYYFYGIPKKKRFSKWPKKTEDDNINLIIEYYKYNRDKAKQALSILSDQQINAIRARLEKGNN